MAEKPSGAARIELTFSYNLVPVIAKLKGQQFLTPLQSFAAGGFHGFYD
jgi:hypothetical protein